MLKRPQLKSKKRDTLQPGHRFEGTVRDLNSDGQGVVPHPQGRIFFVPGVWPGETGVFEISSLKGRMGFAQIATLSETSQQRRSPPCPHHGFAGDSCGGCPWLFMDYSEQLMRKEQLVKKVLQPLGEKHSVADIWPSPAELGYRNRGQFKSDGQRLGFVAGSSREIAEIHDCLVLNDKNRQTLRDLLSQLPNPAWKPDRARRWTTLDIDDHITASEVTVNQRRPFRQGNSAQNQSMRAWLKARVLEAGPPDHVLELFAGSGNFTEVLEEAGCKHIVAVDSFLPAIERLKERDLTGVTSFGCNLDRGDSAAKLQEPLVIASLLLLDPPRDGLKNIGDYLKAAPALRTIIYISCDPATLARDLKVAVEQGFELQEVQPLDLFPQTPHVETLTVLRR
ncbi:class I SAM-dependent RNA methyltransferase [Congregibacter litoralis]|uniref:Methyltransferase n=1 Tax=Congregibacter litoralis KT71 TaxID=314285 RepID=A4A5V5_9GAMM|nr:class I SAM-dependent RNA methyltransferase [Congregibacter litoralis]EAQ98402.1 methyltransferase [Congregibacter litoralis KT71]